MDTREILNELKWREDKDLDKARIYYIHRGAPDDTKIISGSEIVELKNSFFETEESTLPYHRIFKIEYDGEVVFER